MCNFYSAILHRDGTVYDLPNSQAHQKIIEQYNEKIKDSEDTLKWVRIEITPNNNPFDEPNDTNCTYRIDQATIPTWYELDLVRYKELAYNAYKNWIKKLQTELGNLLINEGFKAFFSKLDEDQWKMLYTHLGNLLPTTTQEWKDHEGLQDEDTDCPYCSERFDEGRISGIDECIEALKNI